MRTKVFWIVLVIVLIAVPLLNHVATASNEIAQNQSAYLDGGLWLLFMGGLAYSATKLQAQRETEV